MSCPPHNERIHPSRHLASHKTNSLHTPTLKPTQTHTYTHTPTAICQEAGLQAVRENRYVVLTKDFDIAYKKHTNKNDKEFSFYS